MSGMEAIMKSRASFSIDGEQITIFFTFTPLNENSECLTKIFARSATIQSLIHNEVGSTSCGSFSHILICKV